MAEELLKSDSILDEIKSWELAEKIIEVDEKQVKLVIFSLDHHVFAFLGTEVREILPADGITWIPGATEFIPGVINIRGDIEAVIDLRQVLGFADTRKKQGFFIMAQANEQSNAILVDSIIDVLDVPVSTLNQPMINLDIKLSQLIMNQLESNGKVVSILSVSRIVDQVVV